MSFAEAFGEQNASYDAALQEVFSAELYHALIVDAQGNRTSIKAVKNTVPLMIPMEDSAPFNAGQIVQFDPCPFDGIWPDNQPDQVPTAKIRVDNVGRELLPFLPAMTRVDSPLIIRIRVSIFRGEQFVEAAIDPVELSLRSVTVNENYVEGEASPADIVNLQMCRVIYDRQNYPALTT